MNSKIESYLRKLVSYKSFGVTVILIFMIILFGMITPRHVFFSYGIAEIFLRTSPMIAILTVAMGLLLVSGEFDLSVGAIYALSGLITAILYTDFGIHPVFAIIGGLGLGALLGTINGVIKTETGMPSLIVTLGTMWIYRGIALVLTGGYSEPYYPNEVSQIFVGIFSGRIMGFPVQFLWLIVVSIVLWALLERTKFGNWIYTTGSNEQSAKMMGIHTKRVKIICFAIVGLLAAFAGIIQATRIASAAPGAGQTFNLQAIAGAVVGGTAIWGGVGSIPGALLGALTLQVLSQGLSAMGISQFYFRIAVGVMLILAVTLNLKLSKKFGQGNAKG